MVLLWDFFFSLRKQCDVFVLKHKVHDGEIHSVEKTLPLLLP